MDKPNRPTSGALAVVVAVAVCCAVPALILLGAGAVGAIGGAAIRYWPLTLLGALAAVWGGLKLARLLRARDRALRGDGER